MYIKVITLYNIVYSPSPYRLNYILPHLAAIFTSLLRSCIYVALLKLSVCLCLKILTAIMCIPHWSHLSSGSGPSFMIATFNFQCCYMKFPLNILRVFAFYGHPLPVTLLTSKYAVTTLRTIIFKYRYTS